MEVSVVGMVVGAAAGLVTTVVITLLWPHSKLRWARPLVAATAGFGVAYALIRYL